MSDQHSIEAHQVKLSELCQLIIVFAVAFVIVGQTIISGFATFLCEADVIQARQNNDQTVLNIAMMVGGFFFGRKVTK